ncbi:MAG TPA: hypothetical protein VF992_08085 [Thermoplasmata archaeon]
MAASQSEAVEVKVSARSIGKKPRTVFVAYPYKLFAGEDYRAVFDRVGKALGVKFTFADQKILDVHILEKIALMIKEAEFSIFDISGWNPNVTLEYGLALGFGEKKFLLFDPGKTEFSEVPADVRGFDRLEHRSYAELERALTFLIAQEFPPEKKADPLGDLQVQIKDLLARTPGVSRSTVAAALGIRPELASLVLGQMVGTELEVRGERRGTKYYLKGSAPAGPNH